MNLPPVKLPRVASREEWQLARKELLVKEKELTRHRDEVNATRRELPMVLIDKEYVFESPTGPVTLLGLFEGRRQLIVRHFMFGPETNRGCPGCSLQTDNIGHLAHFHARSTSLVLISRAPLAQFTPFKERMGWAHPWVSSYGSDFNYDFGATTDRGEIPAVSCFLRDGDDVYLTNSVFDRGGDILINHYNYLDLTALGRQEEGLAHGWAWWRLHDEYDTDGVGITQQNFWNGEDKFTT